MSDKAFNVVLVTDPQPETGAEVDFIREDLIPGFGRRRRQIRPYHRRHHVRRSFALSALQCDHEHDRTAMVERQAAALISISRPPDRKYNRQTFKRVYATITRSSTPKRFSSCSATSTILGPTHLRQGRGNHQEAGSMEAIGSCATCSLSHAGRHADRHGDAHSHQHLPRQRALS